MHRLFGRFFNTFYKILTCVWHRFSVLNFKILRSFCECCGTHASQHLSCKPQKTTNAVTKLEVTFRIFGRRELYLTGSCAAVIGAANRNPPRSFSCTGVRTTTGCARPSYRLISCMAQHMQNGDFSIPCGALKTKVSRKLEKCNPSQAKLVFS